MKNEKRWIIEMNGRYLRLTVTPSKKYLTTEYDWVDSPFKAEKFYESHAKMIAEKYKADGGKAVRMDEVEE